MADGTAVSQLLLPLVAVASPETSLLLTGTELETVATGRTILRQQTQLPGGGDYLLGLTDRMNDGPQVVTLFSVGKPDASGLVPLHPRKVFVAPPARHQAADA
jgi:hypothetical protein